MLTLSPGWELDVDRGPDGLLVKVRKPSAHDVPGQPLAEVLWELLGRHSVHRLLLELDQIRHLDEDLIEQLLELQGRIESHGGILRICGLSPYNRRLLLERHLDDRLVPYCDRSDAVLGHPLPRQPR